KVPTSLNQNHIDQLKAHIMKLHDIPEGVLVRSGLSRVWRNPMCDPVLRRSDNTVMSIYDFLCMPSLDKVTVRKEPHRLETSILGRVADSTTSPDSTTSESLACIRLCLMCQSCLLGAAWTNYSLPPEETSYSLPPEETGYSLPPKGIGYSLPPEGTGYPLPPEGASYSLPPEETLLLSYCL
ncbi:hypothetical protein Tco_0436598, partial [Tanacetum coccineum]